MLRELSPEVGRCCLSLVALAVMQPAHALDSPCSEEERDAYFDMIEREIFASWRIPYDNVSLSCKVLVKQDFRGEVRDVGIAFCGDDPVVRRSVVNAAYRASPLPMPENSNCFAEAVIVTIESRVQGGE